MKFLCTRIHISLPVCISVFLYINVYMYVWLLHYNYVTHTYSLYPRNKKKARCQKRSEEKEFNLLLYLKILRLQMVTRNSTCYYQKQWNYSSNYIYIYMCVQDPVSSIRRLSAVMVMMVIYYVWYMTRIVSKKLVSEHSCKQFQILEIDVSLICKNLGLVAQW